MKRQTKKPAKRPAKRPYVPEKMPPAGLDSAPLLRLVGDANAELAKYEAMLSALPNPNIILPSLQTEEAMLSSRIEGIHTTLDEVLMDEAAIKPENNDKRDNVLEVNNYRAALAQGQKMLDGGYRINASFVRGLHKTLMSGARGANKSPGEFRQVQNFIGAAGADISRAVFVPPAAGLLPAHIRDWLDFIRNDRHEPLTQTALMHAQFELLHPFLDGNGRMGRILVPLFLYQKKRVFAPVFFVSAFLEEHRREYYARLRGISANGDWNGWARFFLAAVREQAAANNRKLRQIKTLYDETKEDIADVKTLDAVFARPLFSAKLFIAAAGVAQSSAYDLLNKLTDKGVLSVVRPNRKMKMYRFNRLNEIIGG